MIALFLVFQGTFILFSTVAVPVYIPTSSVGGSLLSTPSPAFIVCGFFDDGHSDSCEVKSHGSKKGIVLIPLPDSCTENPFSLPVSQQPRSANPLRTAVGLLVAEEFLFKFLPT